jgi:hypothetical protein
MRLTRLSRSSPDDVPAEHIATLIETAATARTSTTAVFRSGFGQRFDQDESGVEDFVRHLGSVRRAQDGAEHLHAGPDILHRLSTKEQEETGKVWRWEGPACPFHAGERAEMAAALRLGVAVPSSATVKTVEGEQLHRYTFRVEAPRDHEDAIIARMYDHQRHHETTRVLLEVWLAGDGGLRRTRERAKVHQQVKEYTLLGWTTDYWDFGVTAEITVPAPDQILGAPDGPGASTS